MVKAIEKKPKPSKAGAAKKEESDEDSEEMGLLQRLAKAKRLAGLNSPPAAPKPAAPKKEKKHSDDELFLFDDVRPVLFLYSISVGSSALQFRSPRHRQR